MLIELVCSVILAASASSDLPDLAQYSQLKPVESKNLLDNPSFDSVTQGTAPWDLAAEGVVSQEAGYNQRGLMIRRTDVQKYSVISQKVKLKPATRYIIGGRIRAKSADGRSSAALGIDWWKNSSAYKEGEFVSCFYRGFSESFDWKNVEYQFSTSADPDLVHYFVCYYAKGRLGEASYDDLFIREAGGEYFAGILNPFNRADGKTPELRFTVLPSGNLEYAQKEKPAIGAICELKDKEGKSLSKTFVTIRNGRFSTDVSAFPAGDGYQAELTILDTANKVVLGKPAPLPFSIGASATDAPARGVTTFDRYGRTLVDGKPFMPLGVYVGGAGRMYDIQYFEKSPFNCILCYSGYMLRHNESKKQGREAMLEVMDTLDRHGLKLIFGMPFLFSGYDQSQEAVKKTWGMEGKSHEEFIQEFIGAARKHPALLAWYITDELPPPRYRELAARRNLVNKLDPYHPTCGVFFQIHELSAYSSCVDIPNIDFYPVGGKNQPQNQKLIPESMKCAAEVWTDSATGEMPFWATPQMFSWGGSNPDLNPKYRFPTGEEMLAMSLMSAIHGAKGFVYYYYFDVLYGIGKTLDEKFARFTPLWKQICWAAGELRDLEPFIMSIEKAPAVTVKNIKGKTHARAFVAEDGRIRVLVSCEGPGESEAEITVPGMTGGRNELRSKFNRTERLSPTLYRFKGTDISFDILQRWPEYELDKEIKK